MNTLNGNVEQASANARGFDIDSPLTVSTAAAMWKAGYQFCVRYVPNTDSPRSSSNLTCAEVQNILDGGLAFMIVQHVRSAGWTPSADIGTGDGQLAADTAQQIGIPAQVCVWCDLEGVAEGTGSDAVIEYCNAWHDAVAAAGYRPGLYVGAGCILNSSQLYNDLKMDHYWRSLSNVPDVDKRGYQIVQSEATGPTPDGLSIDEDRAIPDNEGESAWWLAPAT